MSDDQMPQDPISALAEGAAQMHELFMSYQAAGFTEIMAFELVRSMLVAMVGRISGA